MNNSSEQNGKTYKNDISEKSSKNAYKTTEEIGKVFKFFFKKSFINII
jgi:hypothetical protein